MQKTVSTYCITQRMASFAMVFLLTISMLSVLAPKAEKAEQKADQEQEVVVTTPDSDAVVSYFDYDFSKDYIIAYILPEVKESYQTVVYAFVPSLVSSLGDLFPNTISINAP